MMAMFKLLSDRQLVDQWPCGSGVHRRRPV